MELWLLGAGAVVLIAITIWIVWPDRVEEGASPGAPNRLEQREASMNTDDTSARNDMAPMGDRFEDQYTSATGDLSAGGVATTLQHEPAAAAASETTSSPAAGEPWSQPTVASERASQPAARPEPAPVAGSFTSLSRTPMAEPRTIGVGAGALLVAGGAVGGAWLYSRWQHERNKPVNRLRRRARDAADYLGERLPDVEDLPRGAAPTGGAAAALVLTTVALARALRSGRDTHETPDDVDVERGASRVDWRALVEAAQQNAREARGRARSELLDAAESGRRRAKGLPWQRFRDLGESSLEALPSRGELRGMGKRAGKNLGRLEAPPAKPAFMGLGFGGMAVVAGASYLIWRLLRGGSRAPDQIWGTPAE